jgi:hypothetical protein
MGRWMEGGPDGYRRALAAFEGLAAEDPADALSATMREELRVLLSRDALAGGEAEQAIALARAVLSGPAAEDRQRLEAAEVLHLAGFTEEARGIASELASRMPRSGRARRLATGSR